MTSPIKALQSLISEIVKASDSYMKKERVREDIQARIIESIKKGDIKTQKDLDQYFSSVDMSIKALKMIPIAYLIKLSKE